MYLDLQTRLRNTFERFIRERFNVSAPIVIEQPRRPEFGEMALPFCFELAKALKRPPRQIANEVVETIGPIEGVARLEAAGGGYINVFLDRTVFLAGLARLGLAAGAEDRPAPAEGKIIVEHTNINPNKAAHIGHLRNAALGDTFVRILRALGRQVEVQNYIDNTGVQVADAVVGFRYLENKTSDEVRRLAADPAVRFDYYCWDLYARVSRWYDEDRARLELRGRTMQEVEHGQGESARLAEVVADTIVRCHLATMYRLNVEYDLLPRESEILKLKFWDQAFALLKERGAIYLETEGKNKGCWVMPADSTGAAVEDPDAVERSPDDTKIIVRSNGTVTYVGKDIAYQLWKFGLLGRDFGYRPLHRYPGGRQLWVTVAGDEGHAAPAFGHGALVYNVIDVRQSYLQNIVALGLLALGYKEQAEKSVHFAYEMVALSPRCSKDLGIELSEEDQKRPYVEVSGRKGLGVKADDLIDQLESRALQEVRSRHPEEPEEFHHRTARQIAIGALRYFLLKYTRATVIAFDFAEALSFEGETGPYVQYAAVRAAGIFRKLGGQPDFSRLSEAALAAAVQSESGAEYWQLAVLASQTTAFAEQAMSTSEPSVLAKFAFQLAQAFNNFYHRHPILREPDPDRKLFLLWLTGYVRSQLERALDLMGVEVPEAM
jgi:arginyl-tRNA synthetase